MLPLIFTLINLTLDIIQVLPPFSHNDSSLRQKMFGNTEHEHQKVVRVDEALG